MREMHEFQIYKRAERRSKVFWVDEQTIFSLFVEFTKSPPE